jgi:hypothetical protein
VAATTSEPQGSSRPGLFRTIASLLALWGVIMYGYLSYVYDQFYGALAVDKSDVGLGYATTLARSSGWIALTSFFLFIGLVIRGVVELLLVLSIMNYPGWHMYDVQEKFSHVVGYVAARALLLVVVIVIGILLVVPTVAYSLRIPLREEQRAVEAVQAGSPIGPVRVYGFTLLGIRADAATVLPKGKSGELPAVDTLLKRKLLYLGQTEGTAVFFDAAIQRAVYLPLDDIVMDLSRPEPSSARPPHCFYENPPWPLPSRELPGC